MSVHVDPVTTLMLIALANLATHHAHHAVVSLPALLAPALVSYRVQHANKIAASVTTTQVEHVCHAELDAVLAQPQVVTFAKMVSYFHKVFVIQDAFLVNMPTMEPALHATVPVQHAHRLPHVTVVLLLSASSTVHALAIADQDTILSLEHAPNAHLDVPHAITLNLVVASHAIPIKIYSMETAFNNAHRPTLPVQDNANHVVLDAKSALTLRLAHNV